MAMVRLILFRLPIDINNPIHCIRLYEDGKANGFAYRTNHHQGVGHCHEKFGPESFRGRASGYDQ